VRNGRHVLVESLGTVEEFVPNSLYLSEASHRGASNMLVLTGANMSGKSTLLQQAMLLVILAQVGSMVPAAFASVPVFSRLLSRLGSVAYITRALTARDPSPRALVVIDELGRGTSNSEGLAIAWATAEFLAEFANVYTLFATHFLQIDALAKLYPNVRCYNMAVAQDVARKRFTMLHRMSEGSAKHEVPHPYFALLSFFADSSSLSRRPSYSISRKLSLCISRTGLPDWYARRDGWHPGRRDRARARYRRFARGEHVELGYAVPRRGRRAGPRREVPQPPLLHTRR
ncbi:muts domain V-domain-containing protein, partial [Pavlovales sp. CCMP2436]